MSSNQFPVNSHKKELLIQGEKKKEKQDTTVSHLETKEHKSEVMEITIGKNATFFEIVI